MTGIAVCVAALLTVAVILPAAPAVAAPRNTIPGAGTYRVGKDFQAGVYRSTGNRACYWHRARNAGGAPDAVIAHDIGAGQRIVYVRPTDRVFRTSGCGTWRRVFDSVLASSSARARLPGDGVHLVGPDFAPGTYRSSGNTAACYWQRSRSADGAVDSIIANDIAKGDLVVTIEPTDAVFGTSRCKPWIRVAGPAR